MRAVRRARQRCTPRSARCARSRPCSTPSSGGCRAARECCWWRTTWARSRPFSPRRRGPCPPRWRPTCPSPRSAPRPPTSTCSSWAPPRTSRARRPGQAGRVLVRLEEPPSAVGAYAELAARCWESAAGRWTSWWRWQSACNPALRPRNWTPSRRSGAGAVRRHAETALGAVEFAAGRHPPGWTEELWRRADAAVAGQATACRARGRDAVVRGHPRGAAHGPGGPCPARGRVPARCGPGAVGTGLVDPRGSGCRADPRGDAVAAAGRGLRCAATRPRHGGAGAGSPCHGARGAPSEPELREIADLALIPQSSTRSMPEGAGPHPRAAAPRPAARPGRGAARTAAGGRGPVRGGGPRAPGRDRGAAGGGRGAGVAVRNGGAAGVGQGRVGSTGCGPARRRRRGRRRG